jgi:hypothetical protein
LHNSKKEKIATETEATVGRLKVRFPDNGKGGHVGQGAWPIRAQKMARGANAAKHLAPNKKSKKNSHIIELANGKQVDWESVAVD